MHCAACDRSELDQPVIDQVGDDSEVSRDLQRWWIQMKRALCQRRGRAAVYASIRLGGGGLSSVTSAIASHGRTLSADR